MVRQENALTLCRAAYRLKWRLVVSSLGKDSKITCARIIPPAWAISTIGFCDRSLMARPARPWQHGSRYRQKQQLPPRWLFSL